MQSRWGLELQYTNGGAGSTVQSTAGWACGFQSGDEGGSADSADWVLAVMVKRHRAEEFTGISGVHHKVGGEGRCQFLGSLSRTAPRFLKCGELNDGPLKRHVHVPASGICECDLT